MGSLIFLVSFLVALGIIYPLAMSTVWAVQKLAGKKVCRYTEFLKRI